MSGTVSFSFTEFPVAPIVLNDLPLILGVGVKSDVLLTDSAAPESTKKVLVVCVRA